MSNFFSINRRGLLTTIGTGASVGKLLSSQASGTALQLRDTGRLQWTFETENSAYRSSPTIVDGTVFIGTFGDDVFMIDAESGDKIRRLRTDYYVGTSPTVIDGVAFIGSDDGFVYAFDISDGSKYWDFEIGARVRSSPTVVDGTVFVGGWDNNVHALEAETGQEIWTFETGGSVSSSPTVVDGTVFIGGDKLYALNAESGQEVWKFNTNNIVDSSPTISNDTVFVGSNDNSIYALDRESGEEQWKFETNDSIESSPTVADETVFIGSHDGYVYALAASDGQERWTVETGDKIRSSPTVADGVVYIGSNDHYLYALDVEGGTELWKFEAGGDVISSPTVANGTVYVGSSDDGDIYALNADTEASSEGSRVTLGTFGHINEWRYANQTFDMQREAKTQPTIFQRAISETDTYSLLGIASVGGAGAAYVGYKKFLSNKSSTTSSDGRFPQESVAQDSIEESTDFSADPSPEITDLDDLESLETIIQTPQYTIRNAVADTKECWVITPPTTTETVTTATIETFAKRITPWSKMNTHPNVLTVFATGVKPLPWAAIEQAEGSKLIDTVDQFSTGELLNVLQQICEALHHVHRYGTNYENLRSESVLISDHSEVKLQGILDQVDDQDLWYLAPEEFENKVTEKSTVYRIGLIAYELLTGTLPYQDYPTDTPKKVIGNFEPVPPSDHVKDIPDEIDRVLLRALSILPDERHETVLHLRDEFGTLQNSL